MGEVRYNSLKLRFPEQAEALFKKGEEAASERYAVLHHMAMDKKGGNA